MNYTEIILTMLTITTGVLTVATFILNRGRATKQSGEAAGALQSDIKYIKDILLDVRNETKEINKLLENHSIEIARAQESIKSAHKRLDEAFLRIEQLEKRGIE